MHKSFLLLKRPENVNTNCGGGQEGGGAWVGRGSTIGLWGFFRAEVTAYKDVRVTTSRNT